MSQILDNRIKMNHLLAWEGGRFSSNMVPDITLTRSISRVLAMKTSKLLLEMSHDLAHSWSGGAEKERKGVWLK